MFSEIDWSSIIELLKTGNLCGWWRSPNGGPYLQEFERRFSEYNSVKHAIAVSSGSVSIYAALRACGIKQKDTVAISPYTHIGSLAPVILAGAIPIFIDVDEHGNIDPEDTRRAFLRNPIKAVIAAHQLGQPCELEELPRSVPIIEDCSHALGAKYRGRKVGSIGDAGCFSLGGDMTKTLSTGEGGIIVTDDDRIAEMCRNIRNHGDKDGVHYPCFNFRMSDLQAATGLLQMDSVQFQVDWQTRNARYMISNLPDCMEFSEPPRHTIPAYYIIGTRLLPKKTNRSRKSLLEALNAKGVDKGRPRRTIGAGYSRLLYELPFYKRFARKCPVAEKLRDESVWIDWHRYPVTRKEISHQLLPALKTACNST